MKKIIISFFCILVLSTIVFGEFAYFPIEKRVKDNNLIVIGSLESVQETETEEFEISNATLVIEKVLFGKFTGSNGQKLDSGDKLQVEWRNSKMFACKFGFAANEKKIWFLNVNDSGEIEYLFNNSSSDFNELTKVKKHLKQKVDSKSIKKIHTVGEIIDGIETPVKTICGENSDNLSFNNGSSESSVTVAFIVFLISCSIYYFLYKSRFKIR
jgi:hypothetical protein